MVLYNGTFISFLSILISLKDKGKIRKVGVIQYFGSMGSHAGIEPTQNWTNFLKIWFLVTGGGYSYYNLQYIIWDKEQINVRKKVLSLQKTFNTLFKSGFNPLLRLIPRLPKYGFKNVLRSWYFVPLKKYQITHPPFTFTLFNFRGQYFHSSVHS